MLTKAYRSIFWTGYLAVLVTTFIPIAGSLNEINIGPESFQIRLDHLLHIAVYFFICMYFLAGTKMKIYLFDNSPFKKFIFLIIFLAIITEMVQLWVPDRAFNIFDLLSNVTGVIAGMGVIRVTQSTEHRA
jgi:VanZ family protein